MATILLLADLPEEILRSCFFPLTPADLRAVCSVDKRFRRLATPLLYSTIRFSWGEVRTGKPQVAPPLSLLVRSIVRDPTLAHHIRTVDLQGGGFRWGSYRGKTPKISVDGLGLAMNAYGGPAPDVVGVGIADYLSLIQATGVPDVDLWTRELCSGKMDAFVAVLLSQTQQLERLEIGPSFANESQLLGMMFRAAICNLDVPTQSLPYPNLRTVSFDLGYVDQRYRTYNSMQDALAFFYLPNVQHMRLFIENEQSFVWPGITTTDEETNAVVNQPPCASSLISLRLDQIREANLGHVLSVTPSLISLDWKWSYQPGVDSHNTPVVDLTKIAGILSQVRNTIAEFNITADSLPAHGGSRPPAVELLGTLGGLEELHNLRVFQIPLVFLAGFEQKPSSRLASAVPTTIADLTITDDLVQIVPLYLWSKDLVADLVEDFMQDAPQTHPRLRRIVMWLIDDEWGPCLEQRLVEKASIQTGIQVEIKQLADDDMTFSKPMKALS